MTNQLVVYVSKLSNDFTSTKHCKTLSKHGRRFYVRGVPLDFVGRGGGGN